MNMEKIHYIPEIMERMGITATMLAKKLNVSKQAISIQINNDLKVSSASKIADALGVPLAALFVNPIVAPIPVKQVVSLRCPKCGAPFELEVRGE